MKKNEIHNRSRIRNKKENIHRVKKIKKWTHNKIIHFDFLRCNVAYTCTCM